MRLHAHLSRALDEHAEVWPPIERAYQLVSQVAQVLHNAEDASHEGVVQRFEVVKARIECEADQGGPLSAALHHFLKVTTSYAPQLFHAYRVPGVPRTNNDLEQFFGSARYHERRVSGRKGAAPGMVVRGQVRLVAAVGTRMVRPTPQDLRPGCVSSWHALRAELEARQEKRREQGRFRRDPHAYLARLEAQLIKPPLPA